MSESLHDEVIRVARDLIRLDTTTPASPGSATRRSAREYLARLPDRYGVECELVAREDHRANLVARIPGVSTGDAESLAFVGHTDVVPCDPRDWTHPPFEAVVDDDGWLWGRGAVDMKNEVAARPSRWPSWRGAASGRAATCGSSRSPTRRTGSPTSACAGCSRSGPTSGPTHSINEGGGERLPLSDGREVVAVSVGEKGTLPVQVAAVGEAGHASMPTLGNNAVPLLARCSPASATGMPEPSPAPEVDRDAARRCSDATSRPRAARSPRPTALYAGLGDSIPALMGSTMAPTMLWGSNKRNVMPARATAEVDSGSCPGTTRADVEARVRALLGDDIPYELEWPEEIVEASSSPVGRRRPGRDRGVPRRRR